MATSAALAAGTGGAIAIAPGAFLAAGGAASAAAAAQSAFLLSSALSGISTFVGFVQQTRNADAAEAFQERQFNQTRRLAREDAILNYEALGSRVSEQRRAAGVEVQRVAREARRAIGTARASSANVSGRSLDALVRDFELKETEFRSGIQGNLRSAEAQAQREAEAIRLRQRGRVLAAQPRPVERPSFAGALLRTGTSIYQNYLANTTISPTGARVFGTV